jgi:hypothetical protein
MLFVNCESVHIPSPAIPAGNQSTDDLIAALGNQEDSRGVCNQALDVLYAVSRGSVPTPRLSP